MDIALPRVASTLAALGHDEQSRAAQAAAGQDGPPPEIRAAYVTAGRHHQAITADETFYQSLLPLLAELQMPAFLIT